MTTTLHEANPGYRQGTRAVVPEGNGAEIEVRLMGWAPGAETVEGSSGDYPVKTIARDFAEAFPVGTRMRANHDGFCDAGGDIQRVMAKTTSLPVKREDGMYAKARVREGEATDFIRQFADVIGTSVSVGVELAMEQATDDETGEPLTDYENKPIMRVKKSERGVPIVERFLSMMESPYNAVDFVEAPGADGAVVSIAIEAAKAVVEHVTLREAATFTVDLAGEREKTPVAAPPRANQKENTVTDEEARAIAQEAALAAVAQYAEANRPAPSEQPTLEQTTESVIAAGLTEAGRKQVFARIERGESLEDAISAETAREADIDAEVQRRVEAALAAKRDESAFDFGFTTDDTGGKPLGTEEKATVAALETEFEASFDDQKVS